MSDTMAAILILPSLAALVLVLECTRTGCTWLHRRIRKPSPQERLIRASNISSAQEY